MTGPTQNTSDQSIIGWLIFLYLLTKPVSLAVLSNHSAGNTELSVPVIISLTGFFIFAFVDAFRHRDAHQLLKTPLFLIEGAWNLFQRL